MSGGLQEGFEANNEVEPVLIAIEQCHLVDEDRTKGETPSGARSLGRNRAVDAEDRLAGG
jgi:hypothetical protein